MLPPTVEKSLNSIHTKSYFSPVPSLITPDTPVILGVDEAGRGPVAGPMVYGIAYCTQEYQDNHVKPDYAFDDSKKLTDPVRRELFSKIYSEGNDELNQLGYATTSITPADISSGMFRFPPGKQYNLNEQAHDTTMDLIQGVLDRNVKIAHVYVDTVGPPSSYQRKLEMRFPGIKFTVEKKADSLYCLVSVASVVAKVTRDLLIENLELKHPSDSPLGSGYPSDPKTKAWLREQMTPLFGWPLDMVRFSWQTCQTLLDDHVKTGKGIEVEWEEDYIETRKNMAKQWQAQATQGKHDNTPITLDNWYR